MDKESHLNKKIKDSFGGLNKTAPESLWDKIANNIESPVNEAQLENKIKESFETINKKVKADTWSKIEKQLIIDHSWHNIKKTLNRDLIIKRAFQIAAVLLLLLFVNYPGIYNPFTKQKTSDKNKKTSLVSEQNTGSINKNDTSGSGQNISIVYLNIDSVHRKETSGTIGTEQKSKAKKQNKNEILAKQEYNSNNKFITTTQVNNNDHTVNPENESKVNDNIEDREKQIDDKKENGLVFNDGNDPKGNQHLISMLTPNEINAIPFPNSFPTIEAQVISYTKIENNNNSIKRAGSFDLGISYSLNNNKIHNNNDKLSGDSQSLVKEQKSYVHTFSVVASYNPNTRNSISLEYAFNDVVKQGLKKYENGKLNDQGLYINYHKLGILYQRNINPAGWELPFKFIVGAGAYYSFLSSANEYNNNEVFSANNNYLGYNYGIKGIIGLRNETKRFIVEYGVKSEYGLVNIFSGSEKMNAQLNETHIDNLGIFLTIKIKINKSTFKLH